MFIYNSIFIVERLALRLVRLIQLVTGGALILLTDSALSFPRALVLTKPVHNAFPEELTAQLKLKVILT